MPSPCLLAKSPCSTIFMKDLLPFRSCKKNLVAQDVQHQVASKNRCSTSEPRMEWFTMFIMNIVCSLCLSTMFVCLVYYDWKRHHETSPKSVNVRSSCPESLAKLVNIELQVYRFMDVYGRYISQMMFFLNIYFFKKHWSPYCFINFEFQCLW